MIWEYSLTPKEEAICVEIGYQRQKPYLGNPTKNINYSEGDLAELYQHVVACGSELAFARMLGNNLFIPHVNKWKTELDIPGFGEVRYTTSSFRGLRFTKRDDVNLKYVLLTEGLDVKTRRTSFNQYKSHPYIAIGWMYGADCINEKWKYNEKTWYVPREYLKKMEEINDK
jgi:hypothetical protein